MITPLYITLIVLSVLAFMLLQLLIVAIVSIIYILTNNTMLSVAVGFIIDLIALNMLLKFMISDS